MTEIEQVPDSRRDEELAEEWVRRVDDPDVQGVGAYRFREPAYGAWRWGIDVWVAEFVREDPLEREMRTEVDRALRSVDGVDDVAEEDREVWLVAGQPSVPALVEAVSEVVDRLADRTRAMLNSPQQ